MAVTYKRLGSTVIYPDYIGYYLAYSVPENRSAIITSIIFCNLETSSGTATDGYINLAIIEGFEDVTSIFPTPYVVSSKDYILRRSFISAMETKDFRSALTLEYGQSIIVQSENVTGAPSGGAPISVNIFGSENT